MSFREITLNSSRANFPTYLIFVYLVFGHTKSPVGILIYFRAKGLRNHVLQTLHFGDGEPKARKLDSTDQGHRASKKGN